MYIYWSQIFFFIVGWIDGWMVDGIIIFLWRFWMTKPQAIFQTLSSKYELLVTFQYWNLGLCTLTHAFSSFRKWHVDCKGKLRFKASQRFLMSKKSQENLPCLSCKKPENGDKISISFPIILDLKFQEAGSHVIYQFDGMRKEFWLLRIEADLPKFLLPHILICALHFLKQLLTPALTNLVIHNSCTYFRLLKYCLFPPEPF